MTATLGSPTGKGYDAQNRSLEQIETSCERDVRFGTTKSETKQWDIACSKAQKDCYKRNRVASGTFSWGWSPVSAGVGPRRRRLTVAKRTRRFRVSPSNIRILQHVNVRHIRHMYYPWQTCFSCLDIKAMSKWSVEHKGCSSGIDVDAAM